MWNRKELKTKAKTAFKRNYWPSVVAALVLTAVFAAETKIYTGSSGGETMTLEQTGLSPAMFLAVVTGASFIALVIAVLIEMFVRNMLIVGGCRFFIANTEEKPGVGMLFSAYSDGKFVNVFLTMFLQELFTILWSLLFIIPGIVKAYSYRMVPYILADEPNLGAMEVIEKSRNMMKGQKWNAFVLDLSFIGWELLSAITCGLVGIFYVNPYKEAADAELYMALKNN